MSANDESTPARYTSHRVDTAHDDSVTALRFSPNGRVLASSSADRTVKLWDTASGKPLTRLAGHVRGISDVAWSPDGAYVASASDDTTIRLWDAFTVRLSSCHRLRTLRLVLSRPRASTQRWCFSDLIRPPCPPPRPPASFHRAWLHASPFLGTHPSCFACHFARVQIFSLPARSMRV